MDERTLKADQNLATLLYRDGQLDAALPRQCSALNGSVALLGRQHPASLECKNQMALLQQARKQVDEAEALFRELITDYTALGKGKGLIILGPMTNLATILRSRADSQQEGAEVTLDEAEELLWTSLDIRHSIRGHRHPETLIAANQLGQLLHKRRQFGQARQLLQFTLEARREVLGESHPQTLNARGALAMLLLDVGELDMAQATLGKAVQMITQALGGSHRAAVLLAEKAAKLDAALAAREAERGGQIRVGGAGSGHEAAGGVGYAIRGELSPQSQPKMLQRESSAWRNEKSDDSMAVSMLLFQRRLVQCPNAKRLLDAVGHRWSTKRWSTKPRLVGVGLEEVVRDAATAGGVVAPSTATVRHVLAPELRRWCVEIRRRPSLDMLALIEAKEAALAALASAKAEIAAAKAEAAAAKAEAATAKLEATKAKVGAAKAIAEAVAQREVMGKKYAIL